jgi:hypothetical protein
VFKVRGIYIQLRPEGRIYEVRRCYGLGYHDINIKFDKDLFRHSTVDREDAKTRRMVTAISLLFFINKELSISISVKTITLNNSCTHS